MANFTESVVEEAALGWLESPGYAIKHGPDISPGGDALTLALSQWERENYSEVVLGQRLREALARLNPALPADAIDDAFRKIIRLEGATLDARNRTFHRLLIDGIAVEVRRGSPQLSHGKEFRPSGNSCKKCNSSILGQYAKTAHCCFECYTSVNLGCGNGSNEEIWQSMRLDCPKS